MQIRPLLPNSQALQCEDVKFALGVITIFVTSVLPTSRCPLCGQLSARIHSRYTRKLADLPWHGAQVQWRWRTCRFFCDTPGCPRRIFTERLPEVAVELHRFANGLREDLSAVRAALSLPWSNDQVEGQVNRLKLIKRQMFGRAKFDLLRQRVLYAG